MNFSCNLRIIKFVYEDIIIIYNKFGYEIFLQSDIKDLELRYTLKKLTNYAVLGKVCKKNGRISYKLNKFIVDKCKDYEERYKILYP
jgi:hypothetical protein